MDGLIAYILSKKYTDTHASKLPDVLPEDEEALLQVLNGKWDKGVNLKQLLQAVPLTDENETLASIKTRIDTINTKGEHVLFDTAALGRPLYLCTISILSDSTGPTAYRFNDLVSGKISVGAYNATKTIGDILDEALSSICILEVHLSREDEGSCVGVTVTLKSGDTVVGTAVCEGTMVVFQASRGTTYTVSVSQLAGVGAPPDATVTVTQDMVVNMMYTINVVYGFHVKANEANPNTAVTYLRGAIGLTPAYMNYTTGEFNYGSWERAFFMPKPCMLYKNGTVAYYLDPDDYTKKLDGTASDITDIDFDGNAMMEWGGNGRKIWYKIVKDDEGDGYSVYISNFQEDTDFVCWNFYNRDDELVDHFYTPIYSGSLDSYGCLRSLSGKTLMTRKIASQEMVAAQANGDGWNIEVWSDKLLMFLLLYLMGKNLDLQTTFGQGHTTGAQSDADFLPTGALDDKGLFYGYSDTTHKIKVFGMEDQWGEAWNRTAGLLFDNGVYKYKLTEGKADGSDVAGYPLTNSTGMLDGGAAPATGYIKTFKAVGDTILPATVGGGATSYYCDYFYNDARSGGFALLGGRASHGSYCGFYVYLGVTASFSYWDINAAPGFRKVGSNG